MPEHYSKSTVEASIFCPKCMKMTQWRVADGRRQWCIACYKNDHPEPLILAAHPAQMTFSDIVPDIEVK